MNLNNPFTKSILQRAFIVVACLTLSFSAMAQPEYFNYNGAGGGNTIPFSWTPPGARVDFLYPAGDFGTVPSGKLISKIYFMAVSAGNGAPNYDYFEVNMKQENLASLTSGAWITGMTNVISSTNYTINTVSQQWFELELETPFPYDPNMPLIVGISTHLSVFQTISIRIAPTTAGSWRQYANPYTAAAPQGNGAYRQAFGFDLIDGSTLPYCQNFENGDGGFESGGTFNSWEFGEPNNTSIANAFSGDSAWVTNLDGDYNNLEDSYVRSPVFDMTEMVDPMLKFWCNYDLENGSDGVAVEVSGDSGATWSTLGTTLSTGPWYNSSSVTALTALGNGNGWTGQSNGWIPMEHSLSSYVNDTAVLIRWRMAADAVNTDEGYGLDDIIIGETNDIELVELTYPDSICGISNTVVRAVVCNRSYEQRDSFGIDIDTNGVTVSYIYPDTLEVCECDTVDILTFNSSLGGTWMLEARIDNTGDVNPNNDTVNGMLTTYGTPGAHISGGGNFCVGEMGDFTISLTGGAPWDVIYSNGTVSDTIVGDTITPLNVKTSLDGTFTIVSVSDSAGCPSDTINVSGSATINYLPILPVNLGADRDLCAGELLSAGEYVSYDWNFGPTTQTIEVFTTGNYAVTVTDTLGCQDEDTVNITMLDRPIITISDTVLCEFGTFVFNAGSGAASYLWHDGSTDQVFSLSTIGTVSVTVTGDNGCESSDTATIDEIVPNPEPVLTSTSGPAPVTLDAGAGYSGYLWSTNQSTQTIDVYQAKTYTCTVTDNNGCKGEGEVDALIEAAGISNVNDQSAISIWPNPSTDFIRVEFPENSVPEKLDILDVKGTVIRTLIITDNKLFEVDVDDLTTGTYLMRVFMSEGTISQSFFTKS